MKTRETVIRNGVYTLKGAGGDIEVPATVKTWGEWRVDRRVYAGDEDARLKCAVEQSFERTRAYELNQAIAGTSVASEQFGSGVRGNLGRLAAKTVEYADSEARGWKHEWNVRVPAGQAAACWVLEGYVEITPRFDEVTDEKLLALLGTPDERLEFRESNSQEDFNEAELLQGMRDLYGKLLQVRLFHVATDRTAATTFERG